jgi:hypothetical protein
MVEVGFATEKGRSRVCLSVYAEQWPIDQFRNGLAIDNEETDGKR